MQEFDLFDRILDPIVIINSDGKITFCNDAATLFLGSSKLRLVGKKKLSEIAKFHTDYQQNILIDDFNSHESEAYREVDCTVEQNESFIRLLVLPLKIENQDVRMVIMRDITLEKTLHIKYQNQLKETKQALASETEQRIQLQVINAVLDHKVFQMSCLLDFSHKTSLLYDNNHVINEFIGFVVERFQLTSGFAIVDNSLATDDQIEFVHFYLGRQAIYARLSDIKKCLTKLNLSQIPNQVTYAKSPSPEWETLLNVFNGINHNQMITAKIKTGDRSLTLVFTASDQFRNFSEQDLFLIQNLLHQTQVIVENSELRTQAITDEMTGVYNKRYFKISMVHEIQQSNEMAPMSFLVFDIDHFKKFNDTHGHQVGDLVLKEVAKKAKSLCRLTDILFRYGGEEFVMILPKTLPENAEIVAEKIRKGIEEISIQYENKTLKVTISVGISSFPMLAKDSEQLIVTADTALYAAKRAGRNNCKLYTSDMKM